MIYRDLPIKDGDFPYFFVCLPEARHNDDCFDMDFGVFPEDLQEKTQRRRLSTMDLGFLIVISLQWMMGNDHESFQIVALFQMSEIY